MAEYLIVRAADEEKERNIGFRITMFGIPDLNVVSPKGLNAPTFYQHLQRTNQTPFAAYVTTLEWGNSAKTEKAIAEIKAVFHDIKIAHVSLGRGPVAGADEVFGITEDEDERLKDYLNRWRSEAVLAKSEPSQ